MARTRAELSKMHAKRIAGITGRHVFVQDAMQRASTLTSSRGATDHLRQRQRVISTHGRHWHSLSHAAKHDYEVRAATLQQSRMADMQERIGQLQDELKAHLQSQQQASASRSDSMVLSACRLTHDDLHSLATVCASEQLQGHKAETMQKEKLKCPVVYAEGSCGSAQGESGRAVACALPTGEEIFLTASGIGGDSAR